MQKPIKINGRYLDHTSIRIAAPFGKLISEHLKSIDYGDRLDPTEDYGTHPIPLPTGVGYYKAQASMTLSREAYNTMLTQVPNGFGTITFPITVTYVPRGAFLQTVDSLPECRIIAPNLSSQSGSKKGIDIKLDLYVRYILWNGKCLAPLDNDQFISVLPPVLV